MHRIIPNGSIGPLQLRRCETRTIALELSVQLTAQTKDNWQTKEIIGRAEEFAKFIEGGE
jgi:hypothetical protein